MTSDILWEICFYDYKNPLWLSISYGHFSTLLISICSGTEICFKWERFWNIPVPCWALSTFSAVLMAGANRMEAAFITLKRITGFKPVQTLYSFPSSAVLGIIILIFLYLFTYVEKLHFWANAPSLAVDIFCTFLRNEVLLSCAYGSLPHFRSLSSLYQRKLPICYVGF